MATHQLFEAPEGYMYKKGTNEYAKRVCAISLEGWTEITEEQYNTEILTLQLQDLKIKMIEEMEEYFYSSEVDFYKIGLESGVVNASIPETEISTYRELVSSSPLNSICLKTVDKTIVFISKDGCSKLMNALVVFYAYLRDGIAWHTNAINALTSEEAIVNYNYRFRTPETVLLATTQNKIYTNQGIISYT